MDTRREALRKLAGLAGMVSLGRPSLAFGADALVTTPGVQLYTVRTVMEKVGVEMTLERVAKVGYRQVEFAGYFGRTPKQIAAALKATGISAPSAHIPLAEIREKWDETLDAAATIGHRYLVCPWIGEEERGAADDYRRIAAELNTAGEAAKKRGIAVGYHNHDFEFNPIAGTNGYDILLAETDPGLVQFEMDLYWTVKAGKDPLAYFAAYPKRFPLVHVKDMASDGSFADVGRGKIPFARILRQASKGGIRHYFVEHDQPHDPFGSITRSYRALRAIPAR